MYKARLSVSSEDRENFDNARNNGIAHILEQGRFIFFERKGELFRSVSHRWGVCLDSGGKIAYSYRVMPPETKIVPRVTVRPGVMSVVIVSADKKDLAERVQALQEYGLTEIVYD